eukprot:SAG31_NODE_5592_length_2435_cov_6.255993_2_plen_207_part_00
MDATAFGTNLARRGRRWECRRIPLLLQVTCVHSGGLEHINIGDRRTCLTRLWKPLYESLSAGFWSAMKARIVSEWSSVVEHIFNSALEPSVGAAEVDLVLEANAGAFFANSGRAIWRRVTYREGTCGPLPPIINNIGPLSARPCGNTLARARSRCDGGLADGGGVAARSTKLAVPRQYRYRYGRTVLNLVFVHKSLGHPTTVYSLT